MDRRLGRIGDHADRPHQVCRDRSDHQRIVDLTGGSVGLLDAGVIDED
jgi:hypothetical protein